MSAITVYTKPNCPQCKFTFRMLDKEGIDYVAIDITEDDTARDYVMALGYLAAPVVVVDATTHWSGLREDLIKSLTAA